MTHSALRARWDDGQAAYGAASVLGRPGVDALLRSDADFVLLDCQHGPYDEGAAADIIRSLPNPRAALVVRVSKLDMTLIGRLVDAGADGVIVPLVDTAAEAAAAVAAYRYPPRGDRSFGTNRADLTMDLDALQDRVSLFVMIETRAGLDNLEAIAATPGIAGVMVGPIDLSISLGVSPTEATTSELVRDTMARIGEVCTRHGVIPGAFSFSVPHARALAELGYRFLTAGTDARLITAGVNGAIEKLRGATPAEAATANTAY